MNSCLKDFFNYLNNNCTYLILRNWDDIFDESIYGSCHEDIDILCESREHFIKLTGAKGIHHEKDRDNYVVSFGQNLVRFDVRWVGDGYYPTQMEERMLKNRILNNQCIYIPNLSDYYYSLSYHALLQKPLLSDEYLKKINVIHSSFFDSDEDVSEEKIYAELCSYLKSNGWAVEYPCDPGVYVNYERLKNIHVNKNTCRFLNRKLLLIKQRILRYPQRLLYVLYKKE